MEPSPILIERDGHVATLTLNDPPRRNAMSETMGQAFSERIAELGRERDLRAVILTGSGSAFSAGGDLDMLERHARNASASPGVARTAIQDAMRGFYGLFLGVRDLPCPTVAAINGHAIGAGLCVALACDLRIASEKARLGLNFARLGLHPGMAATWTLPRLVGVASAAELLYASRIVSGSEAAALGLVNRAVAPDRVLPEAMELATEIAASGPLAVSGIKRALAQSLNASLEEQLAFEADQQARCFETADVSEGLAAVRERRDPRFTGS